MTALYIIGGIILLFVGIGLLRATVTIEYKEDLALSVKVLFFNIKILPKKKKKPLDYKKFSAKKLRKLLKKQEEKEKKKALKKAEKKAKKEQKKVAKKKAAADRRAAEKKLKRRDPAAYYRQKEAEKAKKLSISDILALIKAVLGTLVSRFRKHFRIKITRIRINVATGDAAKTAVMYGAISGGVAAILEILDRAMNVSYAKPEDYDVDVTADFLGEKITADLKIAFSIKVWHVFDILFRTAFSALSTFVKNKNKK